MKKVKYLVFYIALFAGSTTIIGCSDAKSASADSYESAHLVTLYSSNGSIIRQWSTSGKISSPVGINRFEFISKETGKMVQVTGTIVVDTL